MIIRVQDKLANLVLGISPEDDPIVDQDSSRVAVWDGKSLLTLPKPGKDDLNRLVPLVPEWMKELLSESTILIIEQQEFAELDYEVQQYIDVIKY